MKEIDPETVTGLPAGARVFQQGIYYQVQLPEGAWGAAQTPWMKDLSKAIARALELHEQPSKGKPVAVAPGVTMNTLPFLDMDGLVGHGSYSELNSNSGESDEV